MEVVVAKTAGFCFGVKRAIDIAEDILTKSTDVYSVGSIVHNRFVNEGLKDKGLIFVISLYDVPRGANVIIIAHGVVAGKWF